MKITQKLEQINGARQRTGMSNNMYKKINYISWKEEAVKISLQNDEMVELLKNIKATRKKATTRTKRADFTEETFGFDQHGDYAELYMLENGQYVIYSTNVRDEAKNKTDNLKNIDIIFDKKFRDFTGTTLRRAFGFVDKTLKRCIPKQFYYVNKKYLNKTLFASSIDASSQYPSGCLGKLPDQHTAIRISGRVAPSEEYPFAFYASGHLAIYNELDTHTWLAHKMFPYLFRLDAKDDWPFRPLKDDQEETILMKASSYTMDDTWNYFYNNKKNCKKDSEEYNVAKLIMNKTIGCWHRKDKEKKRMMDYDNHGSYQLAHIVAVAIARGNQKILNMIEQIGEMFIAHICVDGIIYLGDRKMGQDDTELGKFSQEFQGAQLMIKDINVYCARQNGHCVKFRHGGFELLDGEPIDETKDFTFEDLDRLSCKIRVGDIING